MMGITPPLPPPRALVCRQQNVDVMIANMEKTSALETSTADLASQANAFRSTARRTRKKMCWQDAKLKLMLGGVCFLIILIVGFSTGILGGGSGSGDDSPPSPP